MTVQPPTPPRRRGLSFEEVERILIYFSSAILEKDTEDDVFWDLAKNVIARLGFVDCVIYSVNRRQSKLIQRAAYGPKNPTRRVIFNPIEIPIGIGITGSVAATGVAERVSDTTADPRYIVDDEPRRSELTVPVKLRNRVVAVIDCEHPEKDFFTEQDLRIVQAIASICSIKLGHLEAREVVRLKESKLLQARQEMADLKVKAIRAQMNPHFVFNALNAIQHFITSNDKRNALRFLSAFSKLVRLYLKHLENEVIGLVQEMDVVAQYLKLQKLRYEGLFEYEIHYFGEVDETLCVPSLIVPLMIEEGVENLAKNRVPGKMDITVRMEGEHHVSVTLDTAISRPGDGDAPFAYRYANEVADWAEHARMLRRIKRYDITTGREAIYRAGVLHCISTVKLPLLQA